MSSPRSRRPIKTIQSPHNIFSFIFIFFVILTRKIYVFVYNIISFHVLNNLCSLALTTNSQCHRDFFLLFWFLLLLLKHLVYCSHGMWIKRPVRKSQRSKLSEMPKKAIIWVCVRLHGRRISHIDSVDFASLAGTFYVHLNPIQWFIDFNFNCMVCFFCFRSVYVKVIPTTNEFSKPKKSKSKKDNEKPWKFISIV